MSAGAIDWEQLPESVVEAFDERLHLVELLLDPLLPAADKRAERRRYQQQHGVGERTIRSYLHRYRKQGPRGLLFYRRRPTSSRVHDPALRAKLLDLVDELPTRSVPQLRKLITTDARLGPKIKRISDRTVYRFLADHGLTARVRYRLLAEDSRRSYRSFEAPHTLALVQADARDGIWLDTPQGRKKTYLFLWIDDFSRKILFGKYYFDEKLEAARLARQLALLPAALRHPVARVHGLRLGLRLPPLARHPRRPADQAGAPPALSSLLQRQDRGCQQDHQEPVPARGSGRRVAHHRRVELRLLGLDGPRGTTPASSPPPARAPITASATVCLPTTGGSVTSTPSTPCSCGASAAPSASTAGSSCTAISTRSPASPMATSSRSASIPTTSPSLPSTTPQASCWRPPAPPGSSPHRYRPSPRNPPPSHSRCQAAARDYFTRLRAQHHAALRDRTQTSFITQFQTTDTDSDNKNSDNKNSDKEHHDVDA